MSLLDDEDILIHNNPISSIYDIWDGSLPPRSLKKFHKLYEYHYTNEGKFRDIYNKIIENRGFKYATLYWQLIPQLRAFFFTVYNHNGPINDLIDILQPYVEYDNENYKYKLTTKIYKNGIVKFFLNKENTNNKKSILILKPKKL